MSSAADTPDLPPVLPRPSIFISYASGNRAAARLLRDGLDVWYDENELGGGDAWDHKIRRQIRECTYFMPVISAQTEARREGYFRREWRLAVDRSHDMADDVMFLIPVVIDGTSEGGARVPEKFLTVQWLKLPGGVATPALTSLAQRLAHGEHVAPATPVAPRAMVTPARAARRTAEAPRHAEDPPQVPPFPESNRHNLKYFADVIAWAFTAAQIVFRRLPKWVRVMITIWVVFAAFSRCSRTDDSPTRKRARPATVKITAETEAKENAGANGDPDLKPEAAAQKLREAAEKLEQAAHQKDSGNLGAGFARAGARIARAVSDEITRKQAPGQLGIVPFAHGQADPAEKKFAQDTFSALFAQLAVARPGTVSPLVATSPKIADDATLRALARTAGQTHFLVARSEDRDGARRLVINLLATDQTAPLWTGGYPMPGSEANTVADEIVQHVLDALAPAKP